MADLPSGLHLPFHDVQGGSNMTGNDFFLKNHNYQTLTCTCQCGLFTQKSVPVISEPPCIFTTYVAKKCASNAFPRRGHHSTNNAWYTCSMARRNSFPAPKLSSTVTLLAETIGRKSQHLCSRRYSNLWTTWIKLTPKQKLNGFPSLPYGQVSTMTTECRQERVTPVTVQEFPNTLSPTRQLHIASSPLAVVRPSPWKTMYMLQRTPCCVALVPNWLSSIHHHRPRATNWA
jgi:hypothetical protein